MAVAIGFVILFLAAFLLNQNQVSAPTTAPIETTSGANNQSPDFIGNEDTFKNALNLYIQKKHEGVDMADGPCLGKIAEDWVLDIAHEPRIPADEKAENQCKDYIEGKTKHFIELDPNGKLIRKG